MSDPYLTLPPFDRPVDGDAPEPPSAPALPDDADDDFDEEVEDSPSAAGPEDRDDDGEDEEQESEGGDAAETEGEEDDRDWLIERAKKADEYERQMAQYEAQRKQQEAEAYWNDRLNNAVNWFADKEARLYQQAEQSLSPVGFLQEKLSELSREKDAWFGQFYAAREQALWQFAEAQAIPNYAARVAEHFGLPQEAIAELLEYPAELMEREAIKLRNRLIKERNRQKEVDKLKRRDAARKRAAKTVAPGDGRGAPGKTVPGSDAHYFAIPWTRG